MVCIEPREQPLCSVPRVDLQPAGRVRIAGHGALCLGPLHDWRGPGGPTLDLGAFGTRIGLLLQVEQANVSQRLRTKAADFQIILHYAERSAELVHAGREKPSLIIETRTPCQHAPNVK